MAIALQFFSVIIPIKNISKAKDFNSLTKVLSRYNPSILGKIICHDDYLLKDSAMNYGDIEDILRFWEDQGLILKEKINNQEYWKDVCVVDFFNGPTLPCDWLEFVSSTDTSRSYVYLKNNPVGEIIEPN